MAQLLLVEDDAEIRRTLIRALTQMGHVVTSAAAGAAALRRVVELAPDLVILDLGLPDMDGYQVLEALRSISLVPVVVATARTGDRSIIRLLESGADDYIVKPFGAAQLDARIQAVLRRADGRHAPAMYVIGGLRLDESSREATLDGLPLQLTPREFDLLSYLAARPGTVVSRRELLTHVWRQPPGGPDETLDVHISWLRRKLGEDARNPRYLQTIRGVGVKVVAPVAGPADR
ncbi:MAG TPA: response regulator transcription factor [Asanoa sp.]